MGLFERYLTVWVALGILAGVGLGLVTRDGARLAATEAGRPVLNAILRELAD